MPLRMVAEAVRDRFLFDAVLCNLNFKDELAGLCDPLQGPWLPFFGEHRKARGNPVISTRGELLGDYGFRRPEILRKSIGWLQGVMREWDISLVIADNAPCALLAARGLGIPSVWIGTGYSTPPPVMDTFPVLLPRHSTRVHDEAEIVETINSVAPEFGIPRLERLPEVYACTDQLVFTLEMLDPYTKWRSQPLLPPIMGGVVEPASGGEEIFVYFSTTEQSNPALMEAIGRLGAAQVRAFIPLIDDKAAADLTRRGVLLEQSPVPVELIAQRSRLLVNAAQHGTVCLGLAAGRPQVSVPQQLEQQYNAEAVGRSGILKSIDKETSDVEQFRSIILDAYEDAALVRRARDWADDLRPHFQANRRKLIRRRIAAVMDYRI